MKNKIIEFIIEPLVDWFNKDLTEGQVKVYSEVLNKYSPEILQKGMAELKATWISKFVPLPANIRNICESLLPKTQPLTKYEKSMISFWGAAAKIMPTKIGKLAISEGWARSLICDFMEGKGEFGEAEISAYREGMARARYIAQTLDSKNPTEGLLLNLWWTMQKREQEIIDKYRNTSILA